MIKTKLFDNRGEQMIDTLINDFLEKGNRKLIDIKLTSVEENQFTQCEYIAVLIYEEGDTDKETIKVLGDATKELMNENKRYREAIEKAKSESAHRIGDGVMIKIYEILNEALEG